MSRSFKRQTWYESGKPSPGSGQIVALGFGEVEELKVVGTRLKGLTWFKF